MSSVDSQLVDLAHLRLLPDDILTINSDDVFAMNAYGSFQKYFIGNGTIDFTVDCGSHCVEYGWPPGDTPGWSDGGTFPFCPYIDVDQPLHGKKATCPPEPGFALIDTVLWIMPFFLVEPVCISNAFSISPANVEGLVQFHN